MEGFIVLTGIIAVYLFLVLYGGKYLPVVLAILTGDKELLDQGGNLCKEEPLINPINKNDHWRDQWESDDSNRTIFYKRYEDK